MEKDYHNILNKYYFLKIIIIFYIIIYINLSFNFYILQFPNLKKKNNNQTLTTN